MLTTVDDDLQLCVDVLYGQGSEFELVVEIWWLIADDD